MSSYPAFIPASTMNRIIQLGRRGYHASVLPSRISSASPEFVAKAQAMDDLVTDLDAKLARARLGGGDKAAERMRSRGKRVPRDR